jgi:hypothetical protein
MADEPVKVCIECGVEYARTPEHFRVVDAPGRKDGAWSPRCHGCRRKKAAGAKKRRAARKMADVEQHAVGTFLGAVKQGGDNIPHSSELLERIMEYLGGSSGFAAVVVKQFFDAPPGGSHRTKLIEAVMRLVTKNTEMGGSKKPMSQWTDEELERELDARVRLMAMNMRGRLVVDGTPPQTPADFAAAFGAGIGHLPAPAATGTPDGVGREADRSAEAVSADSAAGGVPQGQGE